MNLAWLLAMKMANAEPGLIYFVLVDRFANGNPENDILVDLSDPQAFHGGDLNGVTQKLDYLDDLGVDTVWLSPVFEMRAEKFMGHGAFHGYWVQHLDAIEPAFGGKTALQELIKEAESKSMTVLMDMVYNHVSFDSPMVEAHPDWFHPEKTIEDWNDPKQLTDYQVHGLPDLDQSRPPVYQYLHHRSLYWQELGIGGYRIDAIRHLNNEFLTKLSEDLHREIGPEFWLLGEDFQGNPVELANRARQTGLDSLFDFPLYYGMIDGFCKDAGPGRLAALLSMDDNYPESLSLVTFLDNHDLPRIMSACQNDSVRVLHAMAFQFSVRGIPMLTYGTEALLKGEKEPENRADMPWEMSNMPAHAWVKELYSKRKQHPSLSDPLYGQTIYLDESVWIFETGTENERALVIWNSGRKQQAWPNSAKPSQILKSGWQIESSIKDTKEIPSMINPGIGVYIFEGNTPPEKELITIQLHHPEVEGTLAMVGSNPALGGWDPHKSPKFKASSNGVSLTLTLPKNLVLSFKLVLIDNEKIHWEDGNNRYLWLNKEKEQRLPEIQLY